MACSWDRYAEDQAPLQYIEPFLHVEDEQRRNLSAMVFAMDEACGNITNALKEHGFWQDTIFIMSTDNGGPTSKRASNWPLRGTYCFDPHIRPGRPEIPCLR
jgi:arylsulfatase A-like enzyme